MSGFWLKPSSTSILYVCQQRTLWRDCTDAQAQGSGRIFDKYHNLMSWLIYKSYCVVYGIITLFGSFFQSDSHFKQTKIVKTLLACLLNSSAYAPVSCNPCTPTYGDGQGIAGLMCGAVTFWVPQQWRVSAGLVTLRKYIPMEFTIMKSKAMTLSRSPQCRAFSRAVMDEKSLSRLFPIGGRAVVTND